MASATTLSLFFRERLLWNLIVYRQPKANACYDTAKISSYSLDTNNTNNTNDSNNQIKAIHSPSYHLCGICRKVVYKYFEWRLLSEGPIKPLDLNLCPDCSNGAVILAWFQSNLNGNDAIVVTVEKPIVVADPVVTNENTQVNSNQVGTDKDDTADNDDNNDNNDNDNNDNNDDHNKKTESSWFSGWWGSNSSPKPQPIIRALIEKTGPRDPSPSPQPINKLDTELQRHINNLAMLKRLENIADERQRKGKITDMDIKKSELKPCTGVSNNTTVGGTGTDIAETGAKSKKIWKDRVKSFFIEN